MLDRNPKGWKNHFYTEDHFVNPGSNKVWFHSACKLVASGTPTERSANKQPITCQRCLKAMEKSNEK